jgi:hypothetical protein
LPSLKILLYGLLAFPLDLLKLTPDMANMIMVLCGMIMNQGFSELIEAMGFMMISANP